MSLQQKAYIQIKKKYLIPDCIKLEITNQAASKIQKRYRTHLRFLDLCKNLDKNFTKGFLVRSLFYGLHLDNEYKYHQLGPYNYAFELRDMIHKISKHILFNNTPELNITTDQVKKILTILTKDQLLFIGFGLDKRRLASHI